MTTNLSLLFAVQYFIYKHTPGVYIGYITDTQLPAQEGPRLRSTWSGLILGGEADGVKQSASCQWCQVESGHRRPEVPCEEQGTGCFTGGGEEVQAGTPPAVGVCGEST